LGNLELLQLLDKGGLLVWPILFCSLVGMTIFLEILLLYRRILNCQENIDEVYDLVFQGEFGTAKLAGAKDILLATKRGKAIANPGN